MNRLTIGHRHVIALLTIAASYDDHSHSVPEAVRYVRDLTPEEAKLALVAALINLDMALARADVDLQLFIESASEIILRHEAAHGE